MHYNIIHTSSTTVQANDAKSFGRLYYLRKRVLCVLLDHIISFQLKLKTIVRQWASTSISELHDICFPGQSYTVYLFLCIIRSSSLCSTDLSLVVRALWRDWWLQACSHCSCGCTSETPQRSSGPECTPGEQGHGPLTNILTPFRHTLPTPKNVTMFGFVYSRCETSSKHL